MFPFRGSGALRTRRYSSDHQRKVRKVRTVAVVLVLCSATTNACGRRASPTALDDEARTYVRLAVALGERDPDSLDFYSGPADLVADLRRSPPPLTEITRDAAALASRLSSEYSGAEGIVAARARTIAANLTAMQARVALLTGTRLPYDQESEAFFSLVPGTLDDARVEAIRTRVAGLVGGSGRLVDRYAAFAERFTVSGDRLPAVVEAALDECRRATTAHLSLPPTEHVTVEFVHDRPWSAFARYLGDARSVIQVNTDFRFTLDQVLQLACHEGYPGHHTRNVLLASVPDGAGGWPERWAQLTFSPTSLVSEAAAMVAIDVAFTAEQRVRIIRERLCPIANLDPSGAELHVAVERLLGDLQVVQADVARRYLNGELEFTRAVTALEDGALVPHAEAAIKYVNEYRTYVTTYTAGRAMFAARLLDCTGIDATVDARWRCFRETMLKPQL